MSEDIIVVYYADACPKHQREKFTLDTICIRKTWKCDKCKETRWKIERPKTNGAIVRIPPPQVK